MMATYFNGGSEIQAENLQTLYLMNPSYAAYSDTQTPPSMLLLNPATAAAAPNALTPASLHHGPHLVGVPLAPQGSSTPGEVPSRPSFHYNLLGAITADPSSSGGRQAHMPTAIAPCGGPTPVNLATSTPQQQQGLSLSLNNSSPRETVVGPVAALSTGDGSLTSASGVADGGASGGRCEAGSVILGSKYLKAAQDLLDEVVNVGKLAMNMADSGAGRAKEKAKVAVVAAGEESGGSGGGGEGSGGMRGGAAELTTAPKQELQMKKSKLLNMLDEVDQRYRQYHNHMHAVATTFERAAGAGSAGSYTTLALQTISRQFRCLKDAIASQIKATARSLGEDTDCAGGKAEGPRSRLGLVDHQLRQQRALQQLGMVQHNAWRQQRGLPEAAVSVLRAWLFDHFLHPYPKDADKHMLAKQTGLSRSQVANWFINARVRLWKPMVEEMYLEEMKAHQHQNGSDDHDTTTTTTNHYKHNNKDSTTTTKSTAPTTTTTIPNSTILTPPPAPPGPTFHSFGVPQGFSLFRSKMESTVNQGSPKRQRSSDMEMKPGGDPGQWGFGAYPIGDIGSRFNPDQQQLGQQYYNGNAVSLTLGPPENHHQQYHQYNFIPGQAMQLSHSGAAGGYEGIDIQNRKRFAAQLLPDFVA